MRTPFYGVHVHSFDGGDAGAGVRRHGDDRDFVKFEVADFAASTSTGFGLLGHKANREARNGALANKGADFTGARHFLDQQPAFHL